MKENFHAMGAGPTLYISPHAPVEQGSLYAANRYSQREADLFTISVVRQIKRGFIRQIIYA